MTETTEPTETETKEPEPVADTVKKPGRLHFKRGKKVICLLLYPGNRDHELTTLRRAEDQIIDKGEDRTFIIEAGPCMTIQNKRKNLDCYAIDAEKGVTVSLSWKRSAELMEMHAIPETAYDILDMSFIRKAVKLKPDYKQMMGIALFAALIGWMFGLMF